MNLLKSNSQTMCEDVSKSLDLNKNPEKNYKNVQKAMAKLLKNYPPRADK